MAQTVKLTLSTLLDILGWHGSFLLLLIIAFKLFLEEEFAVNSQLGPACPCSWNVGYGTIMFFFPALTSYMIAVFAYFRQDNDSVPWKPMKRLFELKSACNFYDRRSDWDLHSEHCIRCRQLKSDWSLVKIALSAIFSLLYPLVWLSLSFLQAYYYVCAEIGPPSTTLTTYCDIQEEDVPKDYDKDYGLAVIRSKVIGGVLFVGTLLFLGLFLILYGEIENHLKKFDSSHSGSSRADPLQVHVSVLPGGRSSGTSETDRQPRDSESAASASGTTEAGGQPQPVDGNKSIRINLSDEFAAALRGCFQDGAWQGIDVRCSQQEEYRTPHGSYVPERSQSSAGSLHQRVQAHERYYDSVPEQET
ncbi:uncharacterized protein LOC144633781 [Oculina patagonica]